MAENPFLGVRLPPDIHQALLDRAVATGKNRSELAIAALSAYLDLPADNGDLTNIQQQLSDVKQRLSAVEQVLSDVKQHRAIAPQSRPAERQSRPKRSIAPHNDDESVGHAADGWMMLKEVAAIFKEAGEEAGAQIKGTNYSTLSTKRGKMSEAEFLAYLNSKSSHRWEFDRSLGKAGMYRAIAPTD